MVNCEGERTEFCGPLQGIVSFLDGRIQSRRFEGDAVITHHWHGITMSNIHDSVVRDDVAHDPDTLADVGPAWMRMNTLSTALDARPPEGC
ncbi:hypothetical protein ACNI3K_01920 [Demequina sp. SO4-13]|uniref:hypothetical protein n=1 Tax=Demequina sp. SO4-13 TaxID=3401027 RepID=UPI003AF83726